MVTHHILLRGALLPDNVINLTPTILQMTEQDFITRLLRNLETSSGQEELKEASIQKKKVPPFRLYQPVHRTFHPVVLEACCSQPGEPRLDPQRILAAGIVVRRKKGTNTIEGWMKSEGKVLGWRSLSSNTQAGRGDDPDPAIRQARRQGSNCKLLKKLEQDYHPYDTTTWQEDYTSLFIAPPNICATWGKTFLYGLVPLTSNERPEPITSSGNDGGGGDSPPFNKEHIIQQMPVLLKADRTKYLTLPEKLEREKLAELEEEEGVQSFITLLTYLGNTLGLFTEAEETEKLVNTLKSVPFGIIDRSSLTAVAEPMIAIDSPLPSIAEARESSGDQPSQAFAAAIEPSVDMAPHSSEVSVSIAITQMSFYDFLKNAYQILIERRDDSEATLNLPGDTLTDYWPIIAEGKGGGGILMQDEIVAGIEAILNARWQKTRPSIGRFDEATDQYILSCFIRVKGKEGCPPETIWTNPTEPFTIVPWYESGEVPPIQVELPAIDPENLAKLRPNVTFKVPPKLKAYMEKLNINKLLDGKSSGKGSMDFGMLCGFNIPIITICAFFVLQIFLTLLHIIFWWLPFVRICIPFPKE